MDCPGRCKVAVGQMTATSDRDANFLTCQHLAQVTFLARPATTNLFIIVTVDIPCHPA